MVGNPTCLRGSERSEKCLKARWLAESKSRRRETNFRTTIVLLTLTWEIRRTAVNRSVSVFVDAYIEPRCMSSPNFNATWLYERLKPDRRVLIRTIRFESNSYFT